ncbi:MAG TPA: DUF4097 family beta strand repeat-containing protein [Gemmatimonadaceae bacterium]|nr:DUF4097 family beta strand repeat-containing protein [Gemmatimonadaceae bacterium]
MKAYILPLLSLALALPLGAQERQTDARAFTWSGRVASGAWVRVHNLNGGITVERASGNQVEIVASKSWRRGDPKDVRIELKRFGPNDEHVIVCAFWTENATCDENGYRTRSSGGSRRNDVAVAFTVRVPPGVRINASTVNGRVGIDGATSEVRAATVNGEIDATSSGGPVMASTVNGNVNVRMGRLAGDQDLTYATVNGNIAVEFDADVDADVELTTVNGRLHSGFPLQLQGRIDPRHLRATIGKGGRRVKLTTVNGNVELRKR